MVDPNNTTLGHVHYLPHHAIVCDDKQTTKVGVVYDESARSVENPLCINNCLLIGSNFIHKLFDILIKFRWNTIVITVDIEKAFLMIGINHRDRNLLRFLWLREPGNINSEVCHFQFNRLVFGLRPFPAVLGSVISYHLSKYGKQYTSLVQFNADSLYVDNLIAGANSVE